MSKTAKAYLSRNKNRCRKFSTEGALGHLKNVLFQLQRKEKRQEKDLAITGEEIAGIEGLTKEYSAKLDRELEEQIKGPDE